jgi:hypothetical protein
MPAGTARMASIERKKKGRKRAQARYSWLFKWLLGCVRVGFVKNICYAFEFLYLFTDICTPIEII